MSVIKLHNIEESSIFWKTRLNLTEKDLVNLYRIITSWYDLTHTDLGRKALEIGCIDMFNESARFCNILRKELSKELSEIEKHKRSLTKIQLNTYENLKQQFELQEKEILDQDDFISETMKV